MKTCLSISRYCIVQIKHWSSGSTLPVTFRPEKQENKCPVSSVLGKWECKIFSIQIPPAVSV